jgi:hypothetical protein
LRVFVREKDRNGRESERVKSEREREAFEKVQIWDCVSDRSVV